MDVCYQALLAGVIPDPCNSIPCYRILHVDDVGDNYHFIRKFYGLHWYFYIFFIRILTLKNPFVELRGFVKSIFVKRFNKFNGMQLQCLEIRSASLNSRPFISIVIPTLNRYTFLKDVLFDLEKQDYSHFEVLICDQSEPFIPDFYLNWNLDIKLIRQKEMALWLARNTCIRMARSKYILLFDDDSRVESDWIRQHLVCIEHFNVSISAGVTHTLIGHGLSMKQSYYHLSDVFDTGNALVKREVFEKVGLFDRQFEGQRMGDGEFGLRALLGGFQIISNPNAKRIHLKVESGGLRQMGSWDAFKPKNLFSPRPVPSVFYFVRKYFGNENAIFLALQNIPFSFIPYRFKGNRFYKLISIVILPFIIPVMLFDGFRSWYLSSKKLKNGSLIEPLL